MKRILATLLLLLCAVAAFAALPTPVTLTVSVGTNGVLTSPTNFWATNGAAVRSVVIGGDPSRPTFSTNAFVVDSSQVHLAPLVTLTNNLRVNAQATHDVEFNDVSVFSADADDLNLSGVNNVSIASTGNGGSQGVVEVRADNSFRILTPKWLDGTAYPDEVLSLIDESTGEVEFRRQPFTAVDSVAALKAVAVARVPDGSMIQTRGYYTPGDGGHGLYRYSATNSTTADNGTVIQPNSGSGRYLLVSSGALNVRQFGAKGDNATDDTVAIQAAITASNFGERSIFVPSGTFLITSTLNLSGAFTLFGEGQGDGGSDSYSGSASVIRYAGSGTAVQVNDGSNRQTQQFAIRDISVIGYASNLSTRAGSVGMTLGVSSGTILSCQGALQNVRIQGFTNAALELIAAQGVSFDSVRLSDNERGLRMDSKTGGANRNCVFQRCQFTENGVGAYIMEGGGLVFTGCQFEGNQREGAWISRQATTGSYNLATIEFVGCHWENNQLSPASDGEAYAAYLRNDTTLTTGAEGAFVTIWGGRWVPRTTEANGSKLNRFFKVSGARLYAYHVRPTAFAFPVGAVVAESTGPTPSIVRFVCDFNPWIGATPASQYPISGGTTLQWTVSGSAGITIYYETITTASVWRATSSSMYAVQALQAVNDLHGDTRIRDGSLFAGGTADYPVNSAIAAFRSTTKGVALPRMTTAQKNAIASPVGGLVVFDTSLGKLCVFNGSVWETVTSN